MIRIVENIQYINSDAIIENMYLKRSNNFDQLISFVKNNDIVFKNVNILNNGSHFVEFSSINPYKYYFVAVYEDDYYIIRTYIDGKVSCYLLDQIDDVRDLLELNT